MKCLVYIFIFCVVIQVNDGRNEENSGDDLVTQENFDGPFRLVSSSEAENRDDNSGNSGEHQIHLTAVDEEQSRNDESKKKVFEETMQQFAREMAAGDMADLIGSNPHTKQPNMYNDLARRFVPQYKYTEVLQDIAVEPDENELIPVKAPPELVLVVAKESALLRPDKSEDLGDEVDRLKILRSGDYWNGVWKEDVDPKSALRMGSPKKVLGSIKAKIRPGSEFYKVVSRMKKISPRLLYIINKKKFA